MEEDGATPPAFDDADGEGGELVWVAEPPAGRASPAADPLLATGTAGGETDLADAEDARALLGRAAGVFRPRRRSDATRSMLKIAVAV